MTSTNEFGNPPSLIEMEIREPQLMNLMSVPLHLCFCVPGLMKDELDGNTLLEFVGLRVKSYRFLQLVEYGNDEKNLDEEEMLEVEKLKRIQKSVVKKNINFDNYYNCLFGKKVHYVDTSSIRSFKHKIKTLSSRKYWPLSPLLINTFHQKMA